MRLRTLIAPTMGQAMDMLRRECGDDAIIVSSAGRPTTDPRHLAITAALEEADEACRAIPARIIADRPDMVLEQHRRDATFDAVHEALLGHGLPNRLLERIVDASFSFGTLRSGRPAALAAALLQPACSRSRRSWRWRAGPTSRSCWSARPAPARPSPSPRSPPAPSSPSARCG